MHLELRHLRTIRAIHGAGGLARAADELHITQSALSHQIKGLEDQAGVALFVRRTKPLKLSAAGLRLLALANRVLPEIAAIETDFLGLIEGSTGRLHIAIECHACFDWLMPLLNIYRRIWPDVDIDIRPGFAFDALEALRREEVDLVISADPEHMDEISFSPLFDYEPLCVMSVDNPLVKNDFIEAKDFLEQTLITYPMAQERLDVFTQLLEPANVKPRAVRQVELTAMIMLLVASNRGISVLPDWVLRGQRSGARVRGETVVRPLTRMGLTRRMYGATRSMDATQPYMAHFLRLGRSEPVKLLRG